MDQAVQWKPYEIRLISTITYDNPLYQIDAYYAEFTSPTGKVKKINGFWDGGTNWKIRLMPDELGTWRYQTTCSDSNNAGLHQQSGAFTCEENTEPLPIYQKGAITHHAEDYHLSYSDGAPFLWVGCTAWNGTLKSTHTEWNTYLKHRAEHHYSVIQLVTTQWRGADMNGQLQVAFTGNRPIRINPAFFQHLDQKIDKINAYGLVAAPVLLWALPIGEGRELSPGYQLPQTEAILLAKYMVARYGAHHVIWLLGGDGLYINIYEQRWKNIGRAVFGEEHPGLVALHPMGRSWVGEAYAEEEWVDVIGYQSGHTNTSSAVEYITRGPASKKWNQLPPRPIINMEPCYEEIFHRISADDVRDACYWSLFATPIAGITYGANGIWSWIREGENILNHGELSRQTVSTWQQSINFPGSQQVSYLATFIQQFAWWELKPDSELLVHQPGDESYNHFVSVVRTDDYHTVLAYLPKPEGAVEIKNPHGLTYMVKWFDPVNNFYHNAEAMPPAATVILNPPSTEALILVLSGS
uniref:DUF4038 domain-containing protein n=1 Tax=Roseihalotalea indica TaxID=2867963 RepID=A0AA49GPR5_9BACT|nr:DUF4038 domain-containing protein [Tunicatimonas sp. TK19036]